VQSAQQQRKEESGHSIGPLWSADVMALDTGFARNRSHIGRTAMVATVIRHIQRNINGKTATPLLRLPER
jgi:hypothetical protein